MKVSYSAPAKVILCGEHSVVYGKPALITAIDLRLTFTAVVKSTHDSSKKNNRSIAYIERIAKKYLLYKKKLKRGVTYNFAIDSHIPKGRNLGSSAALSTAAIATFLHIFSKKEYFDKETINNLAYKAEKHFHGNPSGVDNSASVFGGLIYYRKEFEFLKTLSLLQARIPSHLQKRLFLIDSGKPKETTKEMVVRVGERYNKRPSHMKARMNMLEKLTKKMTLSVINHDDNMFAGCLQESQKELVALGVVSPRTRRLLRSLSSLGTGKVTGAGGAEWGSGYLLFLARKIEDLKQHLDKNGIRYIQLKADQEGVRKETANL